MPRKHNAKKKQVQQPAQRRSERHAHMLAALAGEALVDVPTAMQCPFEHAHRLHAATAARARDERIRSMLAQREVNRRQVELLAQMAVLMYTHNKKPLEERAAAVMNMVREDETRPKPLLDLDYKLELSSIDEDKLCASVAR